MEQRLSLNVCSSSKGQLLFAKPQLQIRQYPISVFKKYSLLNLFLSGMETFLKFQNIFLFKRFKLSLLSQNKCTFN